MDHAAEGTDGPHTQPTLLVFGDTATFRRLQSAPHTPGVKVLVVTDGDAVESAWHGEQKQASLARWAWRQTSANEAFYDEARWAEDRATVVRIRRKAHLVWQRSAGEK